MSPHDLGHWTEDEDLLERFVRGRVAANELATLTQHLSACDICSARVDMERRISLGIRRLNRDERKASIRRAVTSTTGEIPWPRLLSIAAVIVVLAGIGFYNRWFFQARRELDEQQDMKITDQKKLDDGTQPLPTTLEPKTADTEHDVRAKATVERDLPAAKTENAVRDALQPMPSGMRKDSEETTGRTTSVTVYLFQNPSSREISEMPANNETTGAAGKDIASDERKTSKFGSLAASRSVQLTVYQSHPDSIAALRRTKGEIQATVQTQGDNLLLRLSGDAIARDTVVLIGEVESHSPDSVLIRSIPSGFWFLLPVEFLAAPPEHLQKQ